MIQVEIGTTAVGRPLAIPVSEYSTLIAGLPGTGKSGALRSILVGCAERPELALYGLDAKRGVELGLWRPRLTELAVRLDDIGDLLQRLVGIMEARYDVLEAEGRSRWSVSASSPSIVVIVDELAEIVASGEPGDSDRAVLLRRLVSKGRAAGIVVIAATQRPSADIVPTSLRDLFGMRLSFAAATREATEMILGPAWREGPAHELPIGPGKQGVCYVIGEGDRIPVLARIWHVDDALARRVARETSRLRHAPEGLCVDLAVRVAAVNGQPEAGPVGMRSTVDGGHSAAHTPAAPSVRPSAGDPDELAVVAALAASGGSLRFADVQGAARIPEGRCRAALGRLVVVSRVLRLPSGAYRLVSS